MPDYFVPLDTTLTSHYLNELYTSSSIQEYTFGYGEAHKEALLKAGLINSWINLLLPTKCWMTW
jgi:carboxyl-terminal processing protease